MTSPSLKSHPITAPLKATRSNRRSLWQQCLAGALCLLVAGAIPANDRESEKPLDRLKQRSARQRWRELRGEWVPAPQAMPTTPDGLPRVEARPMTPAQPLRTAPPITTEQTPVVQIPIVKPVPDPIALPSEPESPVVSRPGAKPATDPLEPTPHLGSFGDVELEQRVLTPRERTILTLPNWPFMDDLDLVDQDFPEETESAGPPVPFSTAEVDTPQSLFSPEVDDADLPRLAPPVQLVEVNPEDRSLANEVVPEAAPDPVPEPESGSRSQPVATQQLKSIRDIQPFYDYASHGGDPNAILCPLPINADPKVVYGKCPDEQPLTLQGSLERNAGVTPVYWLASNVAHNPLYFEDSGLERSGHTFSDVVQPFVSVGKFGVQVAALPYSIALDPMWKHETPLGHYRPGETAPKRHLALPINGRAAATAAAAYTGIFFVLP